MYIYQGSRRDCPYSDQGTRGPDMELATLRELPVENGFKNDMYDIPTYEELNSLPKINRSQIALTRFIGEAVRRKILEG